MWTWRHCEEQSDEAIHLSLRLYGLLRSARNDGLGCLKIESARKASAFITSPACGERSKPKASGEGDPPRVRTWGESPSPRPSPRKRGEGGRTLTAPNSAAENSVPSPQTPACWRRDRCCRSPASSPMAPG